MEKLTQLLDDLRRSHVNISTRDTVILILHILKEQEITAVDSLALAGMFDRKDPVELHEAICNIISVLIALKDNTSNIRKIITSEENLSASDSEVFKLIIDSLMS